MEAAAVIGQRFDVRLLADVVDGGMPTVVKALETAERARLIESVPGSAHRYDFTHKLTRSSLYDDMPTSRRRWLHRDVGLALEERGAAAEQLNELASHFGEAAAVGEGDRAVKYARLAGDKAIATQAFEVAAGHYARARAALELSGHDPRLACELLLAQAAALSAAGRNDFRAAAFAAADAARNLGDPAHLASAALLFVHFAHFSPTGPAVRRREAALIEEALAALDKADSPARARLLAGLAAGLSSSGAHPAVELSLQAVAMARRLGNPMVLAQVLTSYHTSIAGLDTGGESLLAARELVEVGGQLGDPETLFAGNVCHYASLVHAGAINEADAALDVADGLARELRQPIFAFHALRLRATQALLAGRLGEGEQLAETMLRRGRETSIAGPALDAMLTRFRLSAREQDGLLTDLDAEVSRLTEVQPEGLLPLVLQARLHCAANRPQAAREIFDRMKSDGFRYIPRDHAWFEMVIHLSAIACALADAEAASVLYQMLRPYAGQNTFSPVGSFGPVDRALAWLSAAMARFDDANMHFRAAAELCGQLRAPGWAVCVRVSWAKMLRAGEAADRERSLTLAAQALADAETLGLTGLVGELRALAR
jgi:pentatricopeptide repeat protein